ncbi:metal-dependent phosphohydrolase [Orenia metallireducens]|uniref:Metal-dependent phosphohydrolase n=1 Tax=Orenia metallireducens TaxID=1413210 RepID=A0A1C0A533_9FIRM|nr:HDIG domain-containing metalloprotein [Orenia metallireducens]OCL25216.1 metal-dependent phosphohydrolase [Orenia metallireducens]
MSFFEQLLEKLKVGHVDFYKVERSQRYIWIIVIFVILAGIVTIDIFPKEVNLEVGQVAKNDVVAPKTVEYIDEEQTEALRREAANSVSKVYEEDVGILTEVKVDVRKFFDNIQVIRETDVELADKIQQVQNNYNIDLSYQNLSYLFSLSEEDVDLLKEDILMILAKYLNRGVKNDYLSNVKEQLSQDAMKLSEDQQYNALVSGIAQHFIKPNMIFNLEATEKKKEEARQKIEPIRRTFSKGEIIIRHGKVVTKEDIKILEKLGLRQAKINYLNILGHILIVLIFVLIPTIYIYQYQKSILDGEGILALLGLLPIIIISLAKLANYMPIKYPSFIVPVAAASIMIAILIDTDLAILFTISLSFLVGIVTGDEVIGITVALVSGLTGIYSVSKLSQRSDLARAGFIVSGTTALTIFTFSLLEPTVELISFLQVLWAILNGFLVAVVANGLLPYIENIFGITSPVKLLELSNPNHPLLKRLLVEAPGTYHHSIIVGNLAEAAADQIGADSLLARVSAYYHDIGKIKRSYFFTENQIGAENPHDKLSPSLSTLIITSHVKDGLELAKEHKLPQIIIDVIEQHHGTSLVSFFYQEAKHDEKYKNIDEDDFRYDGPKPQTKEAGLIMLADIVEAAVRSNVSAQSNPGKLEKFVRELVKKKLDSGQLDECNLTLKDLDKVANAFVNILKGIFHNRIEYPDNIAQQFKEGKMLNGSTNK